MKDGVELNGEFNMFALSPSMAELQQVLHPPYLGCEPDV